MSVGVTWFVLCSPKASIKSCDPVIQSKPALTGAPQIHYTFELNYALVIVLSETFHHCRIFHHPHFQLHIPIGQQTADSLRCCGPEE